MMENTVEKAAEYAKDFCQKSPEWQRFCDIENTDRLILTWRELPNKIQWQWIKRFGESAQEAWENRAEKPTRHRKMFMCSDGELRDYWPNGMNVMMVFETGGYEGVFYGTGPFAKSMGIPQKIQAAV